MLDCVGKVTDMRPLYLEDITPGYPPTLLAWRTVPKDAMDKGEPARLDVLGLTLLMFNRRQIFVR